MKKRKIIFYILTPFILAFSAFLFSFFGVLDFLESTVYDLLLDTRPPALPLKSILLVDTSGNPLTKGCAQVAESMVLLKELGARYVILTGRFGEQENTVYETCPSLDKAATICRNAFVPIFVGDDTLIRLYEEPVKDLLDKAAISRFSVVKGDLYTLSEMLLPPKSLFGEAKGAGYIPASGSWDRLIRGVPLIAQYKGTSVPELGFRVSLEMLGNPTISLEKNVLILKDSGVAGEAKRNIALSLTWEGGFPLNLSIEGITNRTKKISVKNLVDYNANVEKLYSLLLDMNGLGYLSYFSRTQGVFDAYREAGNSLDSIVTGNGDGGFNTYRVLRELFLEETDKLLKSSAEDELVSYLSKKNAGGRSGDVQAVTDAASRFASARETIGTIQKSRASLEKECNSSICIFTDIPKPANMAAPILTAKSRPNGLVSAGVISTILSEKYVTVLPFWYASIAALVLSLCAAFILRQLTLLPSLLAGAGFVVFYAIADAALFVFLRWYAACVIPGSAILITVLTVSAVDLAKRKTELFFMKASMSGKLSEEAINEIVVKPWHAHTDGEKRRVTVLACEVRAFSAIASKMEADKLIEALRNYHTEMSAVLLGLGGTIEKHEQDATLAFFGSPLAIAEHARRACRAALRMRKLDRSLNKYFIGSKLSTLPFHTRFGIATGEVIAGNIGNDLQPDFAVVGLAVEIAKQLKKVNSLYGTSIIVTEPTYKELKTDFTVRQLDRVRIQRVPSPIRIYELIAETDSTPPQVTELIELFHDALYLFEKREWRKALARFQKALSVAPKDAPSRVYAARCKAYIKRPPFDRWDGVFKVSSG